MVLFRCLMTLLCTCQVPFILYTHTQPFTLESIPSPGGGVGSRSIDRSSPSVYDDDDADDDATRATTNRGNDDEGVERGVQRGGETGVERGG